MYDFITPPQQAIEHVHAVADHVNASDVELTWACTNLVVHTLDVSLTDPTQQPPWFVEAIQTMRAKCWGQEAPVSNFAPIQHISFSTEYQAQILN